MIDVENWANFKYSERGGDFVTAVFSPVPLHHNIKKDEQMHCELKVIQVPEGRIEQLPSGSAVFIPSREFLRDAFAGMVTEKLHSEQRAWVDVDGVYLGVNKRDRRINVSQEADDSDAALFDIRDVKMRDEIVRALNALTWDD